MRRFNVFLISLDCWRSHFVGLENESIKTPTLNKLAKEGNYISECITQATTTFPAHISMLSGLYPFNHQLDNHFTSKLSDENIFNRLISLKDDGYKLIYLKWPNLFVEKRGFYFWDIIKNNKLNNIKKLFKNLNSPFFCFLHYFDLHSPYYLDLPMNNILNVVSNILEKLFSQNKFEIPMLERIYKGRGRYYRIKQIRKLIQQNYPGFLNKVRDGYCKAIEKADNYIKEIIEILKANKQFDNTLFVITGDHGESFNEMHEIAEDITYEHGKYLFNNTIKVPLIFFQNTMSKADIPGSYIQSIDIIPTIFDHYLDSPSPESYDGINIYKDSRNYAYTQTIYGETSLEAYLKDGFKLIKNNTQSKYNLFDSEDKILNDRKILKELIKEFTDFKNKTKKGVGKQDPISKDNEAEIKKQLKYLGYID